MIREHDRVVLTVDLPEYKLKAGDIGVVVHIYPSGTSYELEVFTVGGKTIDVITVEASHVRPVGDMEVMHARPLEQ
jgi:hypothetical protein